MAREGCLHFYVLNTVFSGGKVLYPGKNVKTGKHSDVEFVKYALKIGIINWQIEENENFMELSLPLFKNSLLTQQVQNIKNTCFTGL